MSRAGVAEALALAFAITATVSLPMAAAAQEPPDELTPRGIADSTYAVRVAIDALAESVRRGQLDPRQVDDAGISAAVARLASAAGRRTRRPLHPELGVLWDIRIDIADFEPAEQDVLRARARVFLATEGDSTTTPVTLTFQRRGDRWGLVAHEGLAARLVEMALRLDRGSGP